MSYAIRMAFAAILAAAASGSLSADAQARERGPLTFCGPDLAYLCPIHGYFDSAPFQYSLSIHPACLERQPVQTPRGIRYRLVLVCG